MSALSELAAAALDGITSVGRRRAAAHTAPLLPETVFDYLPAPVSDRFTAGFGKAAALPPDVDKRTYYVAGYRENNPAKGVLDPQYVHAMWLDDNSGRGGWLLLSVDAVGILQKDVNLLKDGLAAFSQLTGCRGITVCCTHDHAGIDTMGLWGRLPFSGRNPRFMKLVFAAAKKAAFAAFHDRRPGTLYHGKIRVPDMQEDVRSPAVYSQDLTRFRFVPDDGSREIWLLNFAAHCESLQGCNNLISADYPCYLRERIREKTGAETVFTVGAVGGMITMKIEDEDRLRRERRLPESTRGIGYKLAEYAMAIRNDRPLRPRLNAAVRQFYVSVENTLLTVAGQLRIINVDRYALPYSAARAAVLTQLTYMELDDTALLFLPCELFPELAYGGYLPATLSAACESDAVNPAPLTEIAGNEKLIVFGLADDELGYVIPPNDFYLHPDRPYLEPGIDRLNRRHYEETNSAGPGTAAAIAEAFTQVMQTVQTVKLMNQAEETT